MCLDLSLKRACKFQPAPPFFGAYRPRGWRTCGQGLMTIMMRQILLRVPTPLSHHRCPEPRGPPAEPFHPIASFHPVACFRHVAACNHVGFDQTPRHHHHHPHTPAIDHKSIAPPHIATSYHSPAFHHPSAFPHNALFFERPQGDEVRDLDERCLKNGRHELHQIQRDWSCGIEVDLHGRGYENPLIQPDWSHGVDVDLRSQNRGHEL